jgi:hypothetical protein
LTFRIGRAFASAFLLIKGAQRAADLSLSTNALASFLIKDLRCIADSPFVTRTLALLFVEHTRGSASRSLGTHAVTEGGVVDKLVGTLGKSGEDAAADSRVEGIARRAVRVLEHRITNTVAGLRVKDEVFSALSGCIAEAVAVLVAPDEAGRADLRLRTDALALCLVPLEVVTALVVGRADTPAEVVVVHEVRWTGRLVVEGTAVGDDVTARRWNFAT